MNDIQRAAIERAEAGMKPAMDLYKHRNEVSRLVGMLDLRDLKRLCKLLNALTPDELKDVAGYAEGLVSWRVSDEESGDAT